MIHDAILTADELLSGTGYERDGDVKRMLDQQGIHWFPGKDGRPWTTIALINKAGGLFPGVGSAATTQPYSPDDL